jgi:hypothetical protein
MSRQSLSFREKLLAEGGPAAGCLDGYRKEVNAMIEKQQEVLERQRWVTSFMWIFLVILCTIFLVVGGYMGGEERLWFGILACFWLLFGAVFLLRYFLDRNRLELLKEIKALEVRVLELTEKIGAS